MNPHKAILTAIHQHLKVHPDYTAKLEHDSDDQEQIYIDHPEILSTDITIEDDQLKISDHNCNIHHIPLADPELLNKTQQLITKLTTQSLHRHRRHT